MPVSAYDTRKPNTQFRNTNDMMAKNVTEDSVVYSGGELPMFQRNILRWKDGTNLGDYAVITNQKTFPTRKIPNLIHL